MQKELKTPTQLNPSARSVKGLNALILCLSDIRNGVGPLLSIYLRTLQWDAAKIGMALATVEFSAFFSQIPAGLLADASRFKRTIIASAASLIIIGCLTMLSFSSFFPIIAAQLLMGISVALIAPALNSITLGLFGRLKFPSRIGINEMWNHCGNVFAAMAAGFVSHFFGSHWIFFLLISFALGSLISLFFIRPKEINYAAAREMPKESEDFQPMTLKALFKKKGVIIFNISLILYYMANGAQMSLAGQILANKNPSCAALFISGCMIVAELTMVAMAYVISRVINKFDRKFFFIIAFTILPIRAMLYTVVDNPYLFLLIQVLDGVAAGILGILRTVINSDLAINTGRFNFLQGLGAMSTCMGEATSQLFAGFIAKSCGFHTSFYSLASVATIGGLLFSFFMPETKPASTSKRESETKPTPAPKSLMPEAKPIAVPAPQLN